MANEERVLVVAPLEWKHNRDNTVFATRIRALGLTGYGPSWEESKAKLYRMFATWVGLHRQSGTLETALNKSKLEWYHESQYSGTASYEVVLASGDVQVVRPKNQALGNEWREMKELVAA